MLCVLRLLLQFKPEELPAYGKKSEHLRDRDWWLVERVTTGGCGPSPFPLLSHRTWHSLLLRCEMMCDSAPCHSLGGGRSPARGFSVYIRFLANVPLHRGSVANSTGTLATAHSLTDNPSHIHPWEPAAAEFETAFAELFGQLGYDHKKFQVNWTQK